MAHKGGIKIAVSQILAAGRDAAFMPPLANPSRILIPFGPNPLPSDFIGVGRAAVHGAMETQAGNRGAAALARRASARRRLSGDATEAAIRREFAWTIGVCVAFILATNLLAAYLGLH